MQETTPKDFHMTGLDNRQDVRMSELERKQQVLDTAIAVQTEQIKHLNTRFDKVDEQLEGIQSAFWRIVWVFGSAFLVAAATWVINGGLKV